MDFDSLLTKEAHEEGAEILISNPVTGKTTDLYIKVLGSDSLVWQKSIKRGRNKLISKLSENKEISEQDEIDAEIDQLVAVTVDWRGIEREGVPVKFTAKDCKKLYTSSPGVRQQVDKFVSDRTNFIKG